MLNYILLNLLKNWTNLPTRFPPASWCRLQLWGFEKTFSSVLGPGDEDFSRWIILPSFLCFRLKSWRMSEINWTSFSGERLRGGTGEEERRGQLWWRENNTKVPLIPLLMWHPPIDVLNVTRIKIVLSQIGQQSYRQMKLILSFYYSTK